MAKEAVATLHARLIGDTASYQKSMKAASAETGRFYAKAQTGSKAASKFGVKVQAAGYQVNDFVVQVMAGQNMLTAFAQQGSQLAGVFGPKGAIVGAGIAIASVVAQMVMLKNSTTEANVELKTQKEVIDSLIESKRRLAVLEGGQQAKVGFAEEDAKTAMDAFLESREKVEMVGRRLQDLRDLAAAPAISFGTGAGPGFLQQIPDAEKNLEKAIKEHLSLYTDMYKEFVNLTAERTVLEKESLEQTEKDRTSSHDKAMRQIDESDKKIKQSFDNKYKQQLGDIELEARRKEFQREINELLTKQVKLQEEEAEAIRRVIDPTLELVEARERAQGLVDRGFLRQEEVDQYIQALELQKSKTEQFSDFMSDMWNTVSDRAGQAFADMVLTGENAFNQLANIVARSVIEITARMAIINPLLNMVFGGSSSFTQLPSFFGAQAPTKATGGPVIPNQAYRWNEMGKEYFVPDTAGKVVKQNSMSGPSFVINQSFSGGVTPQDLGRAVPQIVKMTKQAIFDANQRWQPS